VIKIEHSLSDWLAQWVPASPGETYQAAVRFRGTVSPGSRVFLIADCRNAANQFVGLAVSDQLPPGSWPAGRLLLTGGRVPNQAAILGVGLYVYNQDKNDCAEFSGFSLKISRH
jgi:hypothetical protein